MKTQVRISLVGQSTMDKEPRPGPGWAKGGHLMVADLPYDDVV